MAPQPRVHYLCIPSESSRQSQKHAKLSPIVRSISLPLRPAPDGYSRLGCLAAAAAAQHSAADEGREGVPAIGCCRCRPAKSVDIRVADHWDWELPGTRHLNSIIFLAVGSAPRPAVFFFNSTGHVINCITPLTEFSRRGGHGNFATSIFAHC